MPFILTKTVGIRTTIARNAAEKAIVWHVRNMIIDKPKCYLVLTRVEDREQRIKLIRHAKQVVSESIARKQKRLREAMSD